MNDYMKTPAEALNKVMREYTRSVNVAINSIRKDIVFLVNPAFYDQYEYHVEQMQQGKQVVPNTSDALYYRGMLIVPVPHWKRRKIVITKIFKKN